MLNFNKPLNLPPQLRWEYTDERVLLGWTIRARNYNTCVANGMFAFMALLTAGAAYIIYLFPAPRESHLMQIIVSLSFFTLLLLTLSSITHQRTNFAYRMTHSGVEFCEWKDFPKWVLTFLKWFTGITAILFVFLATLDPAFLLGALIGPGGMGLMYLSMANSKRFQELHTEYHYHAFKWQDFTQLAIATNREAVDLKYSLILKGDDYKTTGSLNVFCKIKQKETVANFIKPYLSSDVLFIKAHVNVPLSTD
ncbi:hypothetical protein ACW9H6_25635 [Pseudomonas sp. SDO528_S397]